METLDARIGNVVYHKTGKFNPSGTPYLIARTYDGGIVKGEMRKPHIGIEYRFYGHWKRDSKRGEEAFCFSAYDEVIGRDASAITGYLARNVPNLGPVRASRIAEHFGEETLDILRINPERLSEVSGITERIAAEIAEWIKLNAQDPKTYADLLTLFDGYRVPRKLIDQIISDFGCGGPAIIKENPYLLLAYPRVGWTTVDNLAMERVGIAHDSIERHVAGLIESLERVSQQGHTWANKPQMLSQAYALLGGAPRNESLQEIINRSLAIPTDQEGFSLARYSRAENKIARQVTALLAACIEPLAIPDSAFLDLNDQQAAAVRMIANNPFSILAGGPGTGKTYVVTRLLSCLPKDSYDSIQVAAPTGKAAKRCQELLLRGLGLDASMIGCQTIHKLLAPQPSVSPEGVPISSAKKERGRDEMEFGHGPDNPILAHFIIIDEMSMADARLAASLLDAIAVGTRVVLVGDPHQLPSVGPGSVLRDLLACSHIPRTILTEVRRNSGRIVDSCHSIKRGIAPQPSPSKDLDNGENWLHVECTDREIADVIVELHKSAKTFDPIWDFQVVSASKAKLPFSCESLNTQLSLLLNPTRAGEAYRDQQESMEVDRNGFTLGDKVVRTTNGLAIRLIPRNPTADFDWAKGKFEYEDLDEWITWRGMSHAAKPETVVNGDMGTVLDILEPQSGRPALAIVKFRWPDRLVALELAEAELIQAYAMTVHKCQGSGFPVAIVPVSERFYWDNRTSTGLASRELFYTACSRAEKLLITVGPYAAIRQFVGRPTIHIRQTLLWKFLQQEFSQTQKG